MEEARGGRRESFVRWLAALSLAVAALGGPAARPATATAAPAFEDAGGLGVLSQASLDPRLLELTVRTPALPGPAHVRVLLPSDYAAQPGRRYPVLYLLHGTSGGADDWTEMGEAERTTAGLPLIVVMPDIALERDGGGWCTNWPNGSYSWETFHVEELIPWVDANLRTVPDRDGRAIAGLSQGGFCSMSYAARHPDLFGTALSYSGAPDIAWGPDAIAGSTAVINATEVGLDRVPPNSMFGDRLTDEVNWAAHDPATLAGNLRWTNLYLYTGNGQPGPLDPPLPNLGATTIEALAHQDTASFERRLESLGVPSFYDDYGAGTHSWPYWVRDLRESIGPLMRDFADPAPPPAAIDYTSAEDGYAVYGWSVAMHRAARELSGLLDAGRDGFVLTGSGSATVLTPPWFAPGARYRVTLSGERGEQALVLRGAGRRLRIEVPLGPANPYQQYTAQAAIAGTKVYRTRVSIDRARPRAAFVVNAAVR